MGHDSFIWDMTHSYGTWLIHMGHASFIWSMPHSCGTWLIRMRTGGNRVNINALIFKLQCHCCRQTYIWDMTHSYGTWLIHMGHDLFIWDMAHSYRTWLIRMEYDSLQIWRHNDSKCRPQHVKKRPMHVKRDSQKRPIHVYIKSYININLYTYLYIRYIHTCVNKYICLCDMSKNTSAREKRIKKATNACVYHIVHAYKCIHTYLHICYIHTCWINTHIRICDMSKRTSAYEKRLTKETNASAYHIIHAYQFICIFINMLNIHMLDKFICIHICDMSKENSACEKWTTKEAYFVSKYVKRDLYLRSNESHKRKSQ